MNLRLSGLFLVLFCACGSEPQPVLDAGEDVGDVGVEVDPGGCTTLDPSLTCLDTGCEDGHECVSDPANCTPSICSCSQGSWECTQDCGPSYICTTETTPLPPCDAFTGLGECEGIGVCEWVEPAGCPDPNTYLLSVAGCFPQALCESDSECPSGYYCEAQASVAPRCAWEEPLCDSCGALRGLCVRAE
ncbi:MAG: hypothetical protein ACJAYU_000300 [Bradymonadia bacterium]|jgi:hypothetical protein